MQFIANEIFSQTNILIYEQFIDQEINDIYDLSESDIARMTEKMGVCAASIPVYASAWEAYCEEENCVELCEKINTAIVDYDDEQIAEIKEKIRNALFSKTNELEDFARIIRLIRLQYGILLLTRKFCLWLKQEISYLNGLFMQ